MTYCMASMHCHAVLPGPCNYNNFTVSFVNGYTVCKFISVGDLIQYYSFRVWPNNSILCIFLGRWLLQKMAASCSFLVTQWWSSPMRRSLWVLVSHKHHTIAGWSLSGCSQWLSRASTYYIYYTLYFLYQPTHMKLPDLGKSAGAQTTMTD